MPGEVTDIGGALLEVLAEAAEELGQLQDEIVNDASLEPIGERINLAKRKVDAVLLRLELIGQSLSYDK